MRQMQGFSHHAVVDTLGHIVLCDNELLPSDRKKLLMPHKHQDTGRPDSSRALSQACHAGGRYSKELRAELLVRFKLVKASDTAMVNVRCGARPHCALLEKWRDKRLALQRQRCLKTHKAFLIIWLMTIACSRRATTKSTTRCLLVFSTRY
jgi:hypothetical protein